MYADYKITQGMTADAVNVRDMANKIHASLGWKVKLTSARLTTIQLETK